MMKTIIKTNYFSRVFLYGLIFSLCIFPLSVKARQTSPKKDLCIVIDPGHGGIQSGTQRGTVEEKTLNLKIAQYLKEALEKTGNNKSKAARLLQIDRKTLYNKLKLYGLE